MDEPTVIGLLGQVDSAELRRELEEAGRGVVRDLAESQEKYVTQKQIARGGMGAILSAVDRDIRRQVAMKVMLDDTAVGSAARP